MEGLLAPYRVLDLTDEKGHLCGRILGDLGADVIKVEPPGGDPGRRFGPFFHDIPHPDYSLYWIAYNVNKRSITLNLECDDGREIFKRLAKTADFIIESYCPGYLNDRGLGYDHIKETNPRVVMVSITPFGQTGPKAKLQSSDLTCWASGGAMYVMGDPDRAPLSIGVPNSFLFAGLQAASGAMIAHHFRQVSERGQHVDVSIQECVASTLSDTPEILELTKVEPMRMGDKQRLSHKDVRQSFTLPCKDGWCVIFLLGGIPRFAQSMETITKWMEEEDAAPEWMRQMDWVNDYNSQTLTQEKVDLVETTIQEFTMQKTKNELLERALRDGILLTPIANSEEVWTNEQLKARSIWEDVEYPEIGGMISHPSRYIKMSETPTMVYRKAPFVGQHNAEVYCQELNMSAEDLQLLRQSGAI